MTFNIGAACPPSYKRASYHFLLQSIITIDSHQLKKMHLLYKKIATIFAMLLLVGSGLYGQNPNWQPPRSNDFDFTATMIATIKLDGVTSHNLQDTIAFFVGNEVRGLGRPVDVGNGQFLHFITMYSDENIEDMQIKVYHKATNLVYEVPSPFQFRVQGIFGTLGNPYVVNIYPDNDSPLTLLSVPPQFTMATVPFNPIDMADYLIQPDPYPISWTVVYNPNLQAYFDGSILYISGVNGFVGQTALTVRAVELTSSLTGNLEGASRSLGNTQVVETVIQCTVLPLLNAPLWQPNIPSQAIIKGSQFAVTHLGDYENQYNGPSIVYDYRPIIESGNPALPHPGWAMTENFGTTMTLTARLDYTPKYQFNHPDDVLAAYINGSLRGVAEQDSITGLYYLAIGGYAQIGDAIQLQFYSGAMKQILYFDDLPTYAPFRIVGYPDAPFIVDFAPLRPILSEGPVIGGIADMSMEIRDTLFRGTVLFEFRAADPTYPQVLHDESRASFCIVENASELLTMYLDADGDGFGNPNVSIQTCIDTEGYVPNDNDCDDTNPQDPTTTINVVEASGVQINDGNVCTDAKVQLIATGAQSYEWENGSTDSFLIVQPTETKLYKVIVTHASGCQGIRSVLINVEGKIVKNTANDGESTLRNVLRCSVENDTITYDTPTTNTSFLTAPLAIDQSVTIHALNGLKPLIIMDYNVSTNGIIIGTNKKLALDNIDLLLINPSGKKTFEGNGKVEIMGRTRVSIQ
jgi:hypothetical protein